MPPSCQFPHAQEPGRAREFCGGHGSKGLKLDHPSFAATLKSVFEEPPLPPHSVMSTSPVDERRKQWSLDVIPL